MGSLSVATTYTHLYNVLNFPAGVVPVTTVTQADEDELKLYKGHYGDPWDKRMKEVSKHIAVCVWDTCGYCSMCPRISICPAKL